LIPSAFVAAVFALHPIHVESVAWASQRKDVLAGLFFMASLWAYARYTDRPSAARYSATFFLVALAVLAKPIAVTLPFVLLLLDYWPLRRLGVDRPNGSVDFRSLRRAVLEKAPLLALVAVASLATFLVQSSAGAVQSDHVPFALRATNALLSCVHYIRDSIWPTHLAIFYPYPADALQGGSAVAAGALLLVMSAVALRLGKSRPYLLVGWLWFLGTLVPMIGLVQVGTQARADRYMYLPLVGLSIALAWAAVDFLPKSPRARKGAAVAAAVIVALLTIGAQRQVRHWKNSVSLYEHAIAVTEPNSFAHNALGSILREQGDFDAAEVHLREAVRLDPQLGIRRVDLAALLIDTGRVPEALGELERARLDGASVSQTHTLLGMAAERVGDFEEAVSHYRQALEDDPNHIEAANNLAWILATSDQPGLRDPQTAIELAGRVTARSPNNPSILDTLAAAHAAAGHYSEAVKIQRRAIALLDPSDTTLGSALRSHLRAYEASLAASRLGR
jgi:Flp pilus assembly protein TadD